MQRHSLFIQFAVAAKLTKADILKSNIVPGVSIVTVGPARGHVRYDDRDNAYPVEADETTLAQVMECAKTYKSGLKVKDRHFGGFSNFAGRLTNFSIDGDKLRGDFEIFEAYPQRELLAEAIEKIPDTFGFSIDFSGPFEFRDGKALARCTEIYSSDIVDQPAANPGGMFDRTADVMKTFWTEIRRMAGFAPADSTQQPNATAQAQPPAAAPQSPAPAAQAQAPQASAAQPAAPAASPAPEPTIRDVMSAIGTLALGLEDLNARVPAPPAAAPVPAASGQAQPTQPGQAPEAGQPQAALAQGVTIDVPRQSFEQLKQAALAVGIQLAARAGVPAVEHPAAPASGAANEPTRDKWSRQFAAKV